MDYARSERDSKAGWSDGDGDGCRFEGTAAAAAAARFGYTVGFWMERRCTHQLIGSPMREADAQTESLVIVLAMAAVVVQVIKTQKPLTQRRPAPSLYDYESRQQSTEQPNVPRSYTRCGVYTATGN